MSTHTQPIAPSTSSVEPNHIGLLIGVSFLGALAAATWAIIVSEILAAPQETPAENFLGAPEDIAMIFALFVGFPLVSIFSLLTLRRVHLPPATFVVGGVTFVVIGTMPALARVFDVDALVPEVGFTFAAMLVAMDYCRRHFPILATELPVTACSFELVPKSIQRAVVVAVMCVAIAYGGWAMRPNQNLNLVRAVQANDLEAAREALALGARLDYNPFFPSRPKALGSPVTTAILSGHREMFFFLIEEGAPLDEISWQEEKTPLMAAASMGNAEVVEFLLSRGVSVSPKFGEESSAYDFAVAQGHSEVAALLKSAASKAATSAAAK